MVAVTPDGAKYNAQYSMCGAPDAAAIVPSNTTNNNVIFSSVWCGGAGDVSLVTAMGNTVVFSAVPAGTRLPVQCARINVTGTTGSLYVGLI